MAPHSRGKLRVDIRLEPDHQTTQLPGRIGQGLLGGTNDWTWRVCDVRFAISGLREALPGEDSIQLTASLKTKAYHWASYTTHSSKSSHKSQR